MKALRWVLLPAVFAVAWIVAELRHRDLVRRTRAQLPTLDDIRVGL